METGYPEVSWMFAGFSLGVASTVGVWKMPVVLRYLTLSSKLILQKNAPKLVIVARSNFAMGKGKIASQCAHAAVCCYKKASVKNPEIVHLWELLGQPKIVLRIDDVDNKVLQLVEKAKNLGIVTSVIRDAGKTQVAPGSITVIGIGPGDSNVIDRITGHLKLL
ncbi:hypothetical protein R5R35_008178 [Gryllus longicercus]|uniref:peptidyl-tRNA hydrolase n=1 Tax=Gryllus longicercus TaxID=2509291 RepID=A0AAN9Z9T4_9ORTH